MWSPTPQRLWCQAHGEVLPATPCRSRRFPDALKEALEVVTQAGNRAYGDMTSVADLEQKIARDQRQGRLPNRSWVQQLIKAKQNCSSHQRRRRCLALGWLHYDILAWQGRRTPTACPVAIHRRRAEGSSSQAPSPWARSPPTSNASGTICSPSPQLDRDFAAGQQRAVPADLVRELFAVQTLDLDNPRRWRRDAVASPPVHVTHLARRAGRSTPPYCPPLSGREPQQPPMRKLLLRRHPGNDYLSLLQFFLNHRRHSRSEHPGPKKPGRIAERPEPSTSGWNCSATRASLETDWAAGVPTFVVTFPRKGRPGCQLPKNMQI